MKIAYTSDVGQVRQVNEDALQHLKIKLVLALRSWQMA